MSINLKLAQRAFVPLSRMRGRAGWGKTVMASFMIGGGLQ